MFETPVEGAGSGFDFTKPVEDLTEADERLFRHQFVESLSVGDEESLYPEWQYEDSTAMTRSLFRRVDRQIRKSFSKDSAFSLIEVGCAHGFLLREIGQTYRRATLVGVEPSPVAVRRARELGVDVRCGTADTVAIEANRFDIAVCVGSLMLHENPAHTLAAMTRALKPGGLLLTDVKNRRCSARTVGRAVGRIPGSSRVRPLRNLASRSFEAMRYAFDRDTIGRMITSAGCSIAEISTRPPRRLEFANRSADANGLSGRIWRTLDRIDRVRNERAWIEVAARKRAA